MTPMMCWAGRLWDGMRVFGLVTLAAVAGPHHQVRAQAPDPPEGIAGTFATPSRAPQVGGTTGEMIYEVPFDLPVARGEAQPSLRLIYRSMSRTGEAGEGWSLGLPSIERAPLSGWPKYADTGIPAFEDRYAYAGQPLTFLCVVGGQPACPERAGPMPSWATGHRLYRLQVDKDGDRFFLDPTRRRFIVQRRGGEILEFGEPLTRSDLTGPATDVDPVKNKVFRWNLARHYDLHGIENGTLGGARNLVVYNWTPPLLGRRYLADVYYTPPAANPTSAALADFAYHVQLSWEHTDYVQHHYTSVDKRTHQLRLRRVAVASKTWGGWGEREHLRSYVLEYYVPRRLGVAAAEAPLWNRSYLRLVQEEGRCGVLEIAGSIPDPTGCPVLPAQTFEYQRAVLATGTATRTPLSSGMAGFALPYLNNTAVLDANHDGRPDVIQGWPQQVNLNVSVISYPECPGSTSNMNWFVVRELDFQVGDPRPFDPVLVCERNGNLPLRSARELTAYLGKGPVGTSPASFEHRCVDAGDGRDGTLSKWQVTRVPNAPPRSILGSPAALFSQWGAEVIGPWGDALFFWSKAENRGFRLESAESDSPEMRSKYCPNARNGDPDYPSLRWRETTDTAWAKRPYRSVQGGTYVDIDGDGYLDRLGTLSEMHGPFKHASVSLARRISALENVDGVQGPALVPTTYSPETEDSILDLGYDAGLRGESQYVDINGDGLSDLVSFRETDTELPRVRPGNGPLRLLDGGRSVLRPGRQRDVDGRRLPHRCPRWQ